MHMKCLQGLAEVYKRQEAEFAKLFADLDSCLQGTAQHAAPDVSASGSLQAVPQMPPRQEAGTAISAWPSRRRRTGSSEIRDTTPDADLPRRSRAAATALAGQSMHDALLSERKGSVAHIQSSRVGSVNVSQRRSNTSEAASVRHGSAVSAAPSRKPPGPDARVVFGAGLILPSMHEDDDGSYIDEGAWYSSDDSDIGVTSGLDPGASVDCSAEAATATTRLSSTGGAALAQAAGTASARCSSRRSASHQGQAKAAAMRPRTKPFTLRSTGWRAPYAAQLYASLKPNARRLSAVARCAQIMHMVTPCF
jgi:hypothetical protein